MAKKHVSLKDLAKELNVSISTISRGLKNHPDINEVLAKKIQELAKKRRYSPNPLAIGLLHHHTRTIGVIVPDLVTYFFFINH
jgi:DNA-binding LacI/PurR family transcriptional regulator